MANLIQITTFTDPTKWETGTQDAPTGAAKTIVINVNRILSVQTRVTAFRTSGITNVLYAILKDEANLQVNLIVTETQAAVLAAANGALV